MRQVVCSPRPPTLSQHHVDLHVWSHPRHSYIAPIPSFIENCSGVLEPQGGQNLATPITLAIGFTTACILSNKP